MDSNGDQILGIHHVTAVTADPQKNIEFYAGVLGLRLVKVTVNYDDPGSYHFYYGDGLGRPGSVITFFAWPGARRGRIGAPQVTATAFSVPHGSLEFWEDRLREAGAAVGLQVTRLGDALLSVTDPDGLALELVDGPHADARPHWDDGPVPREYAVRGLFGVSLSVEAAEHSCQTLVGTLGFHAVHRVENRFRYESGGKGRGTYVDVLCLPGGPHALMGVGVVHHVAFRVAGDAEQGRWRERVSGAGHNVSPVMDRSYFRSIYFREPGGVLFEIATDTPGFVVDERPSALGSSLTLPSWMEQSRPTILAGLPKVTLPCGAVLP